MLRRKTNESTQANPETRNQGRVASFLSRLVTRRAVQPQQLLSEATEDGMTARYEKGAKDAETSYGARILQIAKPEAELPPPVLKSSYGWPEGRQPTNGLPEMPVERPTEQTPEGLFSTSPASPYGEPVQPVVHSPHVIHSHEPSPKP